MSALTPPPPHGTLWSDWAERLNSYLVRTKDRLRQLTTGESASDDGILMWDREESQVVVSKDGEFKALRYGHSDHMLAYTTATHSAASTNTAYAITWENNPIAQHIEVDSGTTSRIVFDHAGTYKIEFTAELLSSSGSSKVIRIWPRLNGVDVPNAGITSSIKNSGDRLVVARSGIFAVDAGDYIEAMFAVDNTGLSIDGSAATAYAPASPSATIIVTEVAI